MGTHSKGYSQDENAKSYGPTHYDVYDLCKTFKHRYGVYPTIELVLVVAVDGQVGWKVDTFVSGVVLVGASSGFGKAYRDGPKTLPAALFQAITKAYHLLDEMDAPTLEYNYGIKEKLDA